MQGCRPLSVSCSSNCTRVAPCPRLHCLPCVQVSEWRAKAEAANKEKEFYYSKLRAIELLCNVPVVAQLPVSVL